MCKEENYVHLGERNVGWLSGEKIQKASGFRNPHVLGGANLFKGRKKNYGTTMLEDSRT